MEQGKICVSLAGADVAALTEQARQAGDRADVIEVRLDSMERPDVPACCAALAKPLLFTNRPTWEGGAFSGSEEQRMEPLLEAIRQQAAYVDCELRAERSLQKQLLKAISDGPTRLILSWHDFESTPHYVDLLDLLTQMMNSEAHIGKIVTTAHSPEDVLQLLQIQRYAVEAGFPLSCFCMGEAGRISRLATLYLGGYMTYACLNDARATAPGQLTLDRLRQLTALLA